MIITNNAGLPEPLVEAIKQQTHRRGDYSVTELINPVQQTILKRRHEAEITEDAADRLWSLFGTAVHKALEQGNKAGITEGYIETDILGMKISGTADLYEAGGTISDYKVTSAWSLVYGSRETEWAAQLNAYAYLYQSLGFEVTKLQVVAILRDWSAINAKRDPAYPQNKVEVLPIEMYSKEVTKTWLELRVGAVQKAALRLDNLPECTTAERWETKTTYAVMQAGRKSAVIVYEELPEAEKHIAGKKGLFIETRVGEAKRCEYYCSVKDFCEQYKKEHAEK